jgi:hypothetical protein
MFWVILGLAGALLELLVNIFLIWQNWAKNLAHGIYFRTSSVAQPSTMVFC